MEDWFAILGRERSATDQLPGYYWYRHGKGCPWQPLEIRWDGLLWHCFLIGKPVPKSGARDPLNIPLIRDRGPFRPVTFDDWDRLLACYDNPKPGSPYASPNEPVSLKRSAPL